MEYIRKSAERGHLNFGWLDTKHSFSFGEYYDPKHMGFGILRVINDDTIAGGGGFDTHGHRDMEIITYVIDGALKHKDSMGNEFIVSAGEVQRMSAGTGVLHSEFNASDTDPVHLLQIWILPEENGIDPGYEQNKVIPSGKLTPLVTRSGVEGSLHIHQDANLYLLTLDEAEAYRFSCMERSGYLQVIKGDVTFKGQHLKEGDGFGIDLAENLSAVAGEEGVTALWFDLPGVRN